MMRWGLLSVLVVMLLSASAALAQKEAAEGGDYYVTGTELDGREYTGGMEILTSGDGYVVSYQLGTPLYGAGVQLDDVFAVAAGGAQCTVAAYKRTDDGFEGIWTTLGATTVQEERAVIVSNQETVLDMTVSGVGPDGRSYEGTMLVTFTSDATVNLEQTIDSGNISGTGIVVGDIFAVAWGDTSCSIAAYEVQDDGSLVGSWTLIGQTEVASEAATPVNIVGQHIVEGTNQDGSQYEGTLDVSADNQVHSFTWVVNGQSLEGVGILRGNVVTAGFGSEECAVMSYFVLPTGALSGQWAFIGTDTSGSEVALLPEGKGAAEDLSGSYDVTGINPDGSEYSGSLSIAPNRDGETLGLTWVFGNNTPVEGVGIRQGNMLLAGYGPQGCGVNVFNVTLDDMSGPFAQLGIDGTGTETARR
jgi:hypothetical protein